MTTSFVDVIDLWPSSAAVAADLGIPHGVAKQWRRRNSIPAMWWSSLIAAARRRGIPGVTAERLTACAALRQTEAA